jgi:hypothetical protein
MSPKSAVPVRVTPEINIITTNRSNNYPFYVKLIIFYRFFCPCAALHVCTGQGMPHVPEEECPHPPKEYAASPGGEKMIKK